MKDGAIGARKEAKNASRMDATKEAFNITNEKTPRWTSKRWSMR
jgi:hypothetical protein